MTNLLKLDKVRKDFSVGRQTIQALQETSLSVNSGEFLTVVGPSGCGKSTLLRIIADLIPSSAGKLQWSYQPSLGLVFQNYALFPFMTAFENIELGLKMQGLDKDTRQTKVRELVSEMGLAGFEYKHPKELSGGMKQRVGIARSLAVNPELLLLDEPFSALDEFTSETLRQLLLTIWRERHLTIVMVTHLIAEAIELGDKILLMSASEHHHHELFPVDLPRPRNLRSDKFFRLEDHLKAEWRARQK